MAYSLAFLADLDRTVTRTRLTRYLVACHGNLELALRLYEQNVFLSEALFGFLHGLEIIVRNSLHFTSSSDLGVEDWYHHALQTPWVPPAPRSLAFTPAMQNMVAQARANTRRAASVGKLIAELPFGFWTSLLSNRYEDLWRRSLHRAFPHAHTRRQVIHWRLDTIRCLRNRVAHHEPVLSSQGKVYTGLERQRMISLAEMLECVTWVSPATADWLRTSTRYLAAEEVLKQLATSGFRL